MTTRVLLPSRLQRYPLRRPEREHHQALQHPERQQGRGRRLMICAQRCVRLRQLLHPLRPLHGHRC
jgi:hypothetical protein